MNNNNNNRQFPSILLYSTLAPFSLLLLSLLAPYISPFLPYIGLGPNIALFFFYFLYLFLQYIFPTLGLLVYSPIGHPKVPLQFIQACFNILLFDNLYSLKAWVTCTSHVHKDTSLKTRQIKVKKTRSLDHQSINPFH